MFSFLKKSNRDNTLVAERPKQKQTTNEIIEEIHETFYTEVERLLAEAKVLLSEDTDKQNLIEKSARLKSLGFTNTKEVQEAELEINRIADLQLVNESKKTLQEAITYFSFKYPHYKFITEESVKRICAKYNLIYGEIGRYLGTVPEKNLKNIEAFKIHEDDECYVYEKFSVFAIGDHFINREFSNGRKYKTFSEHKNDKPMSVPYQTRGGISRIVDMKCPLEIAAPKKDFNTNGMSVEDFKLVMDIPDPVVLKPVIFKGQKHYLIIDAWGLEASDNLVVNANHN